MSCFAWEISAFASWPPCRHVGSHGLENRSRAQMNQEKKRRCANAHFVRSLAPLLHVVIGLELAGILPHIADSPADAQNVIDSPLEWIGSSAEALSVLLFCRFSSGLHAISRRTLFSDHYRGLVFFADDWLQDGNQTLDLVFAKAQSFELRADFVELCTRRITRDAINVLICFRIHALSRRVV